MGEINESLKNEFGEAWAPASCISTRIRTAKMDLPTGPPSDRESMISESDKPGF